MSQKKRHSYAKLNWSHFFFFLDLRIWTVVKIRIFYFFLSRTFYDQFSSKNEASFLHKSSCLSNRWTVRFFGYYPDFETNECRWRRCRCLMWCNIEHWRGFDSIKSVDLPVSLYEGGRSCEDWIVSIDFFHSVHNLAVIIRQLLMCSFFVRLFIIYIYIFIYIHIYKLYLVFAFV